MKKVILLLQEKTCKKSKNLQSQLWIFINWPISRQTRLYLTKNKFW